MGASCPSRSTHTRVRPSDPPSPSTYISRPSSEILKLAAPLVLTKTPGLERRVGVRGHSREIRGPPVILYQRGPLFEDEPLELVDAQPGHQKLNPPDPFHEGEDTAPLPRSEPWRSLASPGQPHRAERCSGPRRPRLC